MASFSSGTNTTSEQRYVRWAQDVFSCGCVRDASGRGICPYHGGVRVARRGGFEPIASSDGKAGMTAEEALGWGDTT